jgi:hypothetical protein
MKNKNFQILKIGTFLPLSVKLILETVKDGRQQTLSDGNTSHDPFDQVS